MFFFKCVNEKNYLLENDLAFARFDDFPVNKGHLKAIPKRHVKDWWEATDEERKTILDLIDQAKKIIDEKYNPDGDVENPRGEVRGVIPDKQKY